MTQITLTGGIDSGKRHLDLAIYPGADRIRVANTPEGVQAAVRWFTERHVGTVRIEASGGVERLVRDALIEAGIDVRVFDPARVRHFARAKGLRAKSDPIDAALIAEFTAAFPAIAPTAHEPRREELAGLVRARRLVIAKRTDLAKALDAAPAAAKPALEAAISQLSAKLRLVRGTAETEIDAAITERVAADKQMTKVATALATAPGVGSVTAAPRTKRSLADSWSPCCRNSATSPAARSRPLSAWRRSTMTAETATAGAMLPVVVPMPAERSIWRRSAPATPAGCSARSISASSRAASRPRSP
jgi:transposase